MLGDSATRPYSRPGKRLSMEHPLESPCDWISEPWRVNLNLLIVQTTHKNEVNPIKGRTRSGTYTTNNQTGKTMTKEPLLSFKAAKICSLTRIITHLS